MIKYEDLEKHLGHKIFMVGFESHGGGSHKECIHIECDDCNEVLVECSRDLKEDRQER